MFRVGQADESLTNAGGSELISSLDARIPREKWIDIPVGS